jgi:recombination protein RecT
MTNALATPVQRTRAAAKLISEELAKKSTTLRHLLPPGVSPDRLRTLVLTSFSKNPRLMECDVQSILGAVYECAKLGLEPDTGTQECHLIPYKGRATFQLGFRGMVKLARRALGDATPIWSGHVRAGDHFVHHETPPTLEHSRMMVEREEDGTMWKVPATERERGPLIAAYACARFSDGFILPRVCYEDEIKRARKASKAKDGPWVHHEAAMWEKTAVKRLCKLLPLPEYVGRAIELDDAADDSRDQGFSAKWENLEREDERSLPDYIEGDAICSICGRSGEHAEGCPDAAVDGP